MTSKEKNEIEKIMYDKVYDELNRNRDWPLKVMAFASALYITLIGILKIDNRPTHLDCVSKITITVILSIFTVLTLIVIIRQHLNYLKHQNILKAIQKEWKIDEIKGIPKSWIEYDENAKKQ
jgi:hypothetical protein